MGFFVNGPANEIEVLARRKVSNAESATKLETELTATLTKFHEEKKTINISDFDLSQNHCPAQSFETLFGVLATAGVRVQRLRFFGCPTFTDEVAYQFAEYLRLVTADTAPSELHLSDCALSSDGFEAIMSAIEENDAFPISNAVTKKKTPLYMRLENNYIDEAAIKDKVDAKVIKVFTKSWDTKISGLSGDAKVLLMKGRNTSGFQQKTGSPPAAEDVAPVRKEVFESWKQGGQSWGQQASGALCSSWGQQELEAVAALGLDPATVQAAVELASMWQQEPSWQQPSWQQASWQPQQGWAQQAKGSSKGPWQGQKSQAVAAFTKTISPMSLKPKLMTPAPKAKAASKGTFLVPATTGIQTGVAKSASGKGAGAAPGAGESCKWCAKGECWTHGKGGSAKGGTQVASAGGKGVGITFRQPQAAGTAGSATDRSRTPAKIKKTPIQPKLPPPGAKKAPPKPWQEQFSEEYGIPYFWNPVTQASSWEMPE